MNKSIVLILCLTLLASFTQAQINLKKLKKAISGESLTSDEVAAGLKEALTNGVSKGSDLVSKVDG
jgi:hypothetical protein